MNSKVAIFCIAFISITNAFVIIGPQSYNTKVASRSYLPPVQSFHRSNVVADTVHIPATHTVHHDVHSDESVIAGPSGVIKTHRVKSKPAAIVSHAQPVLRTQVVHPVVHSIVQPVQPVYQPAVHYQAPVYYAQQEHVPLNPVYRVYNQPRVATVYNQPQVATVGSYYVH